MDSGQGREVVEWTAVWEEGEGENRLVDRNPRNPYRRCRVHWRCRSHRPRKIRWRASHTTFRKCQEVLGVEEDTDLGEVRRVVAASEAVGTDVENMEDVEARAEVWTAGEGAEAVAAGEGGREEEETVGRVEEEGAEEEVEAQGGEGREEAVPAWHPCM